jgi:DNA repair exonuclease SbcCD ATPase subunit
VELISKAEAEAEDLRAQAEAEATANAVHLITKAEDEAEDLAAHSRADVKSERDELLDMRAEVAAAQDALEMERQALSAETEALASRGEQLEGRQAEVDKAANVIERKSSLLAEAQEAFVTERTLLQRRWAEVEQQGVAALERAHSEAERILREARSHAAEIVDDEPVESHRSSASVPVTAQEALARLDKLVSRTKREAADRTSAEEDEFGHDNDTAMSGSWSERRNDEADLDSAEESEGVATFDVQADPPNTLD